MDKKITRTYLEGKLISDGPTKKSKCLYTPSFKDFEVFYLENRANKNRENPFEGIPIRSVLLSIGEALVKKCIISGMCINLPRGFGKVMTIERDTEYDSVREMKNFFYMDLERYTTIFNKSMILDKNQYRIVWTGAANKLISMYFTSFYLAPMKSIFAILKRTMGINVKNRLEDNKHEYIKHARPFELEGYFNYEKDKHKKIVKNIRAGKKSKGLKTNLFP